MFELKRFLRDLPVAMAREYLTAHGVQVVPPNDARNAETEDAFFDAIQRARALTRHAVEANFREARELADREGYTAIVQSKAGIALKPRLEALSTFTERALWVHWHHPDAFALAMQGRFLGQSPLIRSAQVAKLPPGLAIHTRRMADFTLAVQAFYQRQQGCPVHVQAEVMALPTDDAVEILIVIDDPERLPVKRARGERQTHATRPTIVMSLVYRPSIGVLKTVTAGGVAYHRMLRDAVVAHLLEPHHAVEVVPIRFRLDRFRHGALIEPPIPGIVRARVHELELLKRGTGVTVRLTGSPVESADEAAADFPSEAHDVVRATLAMHFSHGNDAHPSRERWIDLQHDGHVRWTLVHPHERDAMEIFLVRLGLGDGRED